MFFSFGSVYAESEVYTKVQTEATGDNASVHTEITNIVNQKEVKVESDDQGEIKVEVKDGEVNIESNTEASPTIVVSDVSEEEKTEGIEKEEEEIINQVEEIQAKIFSFLENFFSRLRDSLAFWH
ncbi:hypothetical protein AMJ51_02580 [Microgenomates bacterium DG_75]|nr:MAG: hypothetical protein AMJ51_02580 [Microgenomates bacterium DG_75]